MRIVENNWPIKKALLILGISTLCTLLLASLLYFFFRKCREQRRCSDRYKIALIVQTGPEKEALKTAYLAELLGLSCDAPKNLYALDLKKAEAALLSSPLISTAKVKRLPPNGLYIDYSVRRPLAWISDYRNIAIDSEGYLFPFAPFLTPKEMPEIFLGLPPFEAPEDSCGRTGGRFRTPLKNIYLTLALDVLNAFTGSPWKEGLLIRRIDVSNAFASSLGRREIVLFTEEEITSKEQTFIFPKILRLCPKEWHQQLQNFFALRRSMVEDYKKQLAQEKKTQGSRFSPRIIDLRVPQLAFVENQS